MKKSTTFQPMYLSTSKGFPGSRRRHMAWHSETHCEHVEYKQAGGHQVCCKFSRLKNFFPGTIGAQVASSNQVLTSVGWGVQRGGGRAVGVRPHR